MRIVKVLFTILLMVAVLPRMFGQWERSTFINDGPFGFFHKVSMSFVSPDTGYIACHFYEIDTSYYFNTSDSGKTWKIFDTILNYSSYDLAYKHGWGLSCGSSGEDAAIELIDQNWGTRNKIIFNEYTEINQINIVDSNHAVFLGVNRDTTYVLGLFEKNEDQIQLVKQNDIGKSIIGKIDFFNDSAGFFLSMYNLYRTEDLGKTVEIIGSKASHYDFYSIDTGIYIYKGIYKTSNRGSSWEELENWQSGVKSNTVIKMNSLESFYIITNWSGTSQSSTLSHYTTSSGCDGGQIFHHRNMDPVWDFFFVSKNQGYIASNCGILLRTMNNGGFTNINFATEGFHVISMFPNPTDGIFTLKYPAYRINGSMLVWITDLNGKTIWNKTYKSRTEYTTIDLSGVENGVYIVTVSFDDLVVKRKIIKY